MQITFDPHNPDDLATLARLLGSTADTVQQPAAPAPAPAEPAREPETYNPSVEQEEQHDPAETDIHGMTWDEEIHSNPPNKNADGSWRARRGRKDEYDAAIAAHKQAATVDAGEAMQAASDTPPAMPSDTPPAMPAAPAPSTPPEPISYEAMGTRFMARHTAGTLPVAYEQIYADLGVINPTDTTNQTQIAKIWHYLDALDQDMDHAGAVRHALGSV